MAMRRMVILLAVLPVTQPAYAGFDVDQSTSGILLNTHWRFNSIEHTITILEEPPNDAVFVFTVTDPDTGGGLTYIDMIDTLMTSGTIRLQVGSPGAGNEGATEVYEIAINPGTVNSIIHGIYTTGPFLRDASMTVDSVVGDVIFGDGGTNVLVNNMTVEENLSAEIRVQGSLSHQIKVKGDVTGTGSIYVEGFTWNLGDIRIEGSLLGDITIDEYVGSGRSITINADFAGTDDCVGDITIDGSLAGDINIMKTTGVDSGNLKGAIDVASTGGYFADNIGVAGGIIDDRT